MKTITIAAYNRPSNLRFLINSLKEQIRCDGWKVLIHIDGGGDKKDLVVQEAERLDFLPKEIITLDRNYGINRNTYAAMHRVYEVWGSDWNFYLEDDLILSPDALYLCNWFIDNYYTFNAKIAALCLFNLHGNRNPETLCLSRRFTGWGFLMSQKSWELYAKSSWFACEPNMWDNCVAKGIRREGKDVVNMFPDLSRVSNTGKIGTHFTTEVWDSRMKGHVWQREPREFKYEYRS